MAGVLIGVSGLHRIVPPGAQAIGLEAALGAFAAGLILSASKHTHDIDCVVKPLVALFATVFFVLIGTGMDLSVLNPFDPANREGLIVAAFLLVVPIVGKIAAGWSYNSKEPTNRLVVGLGMRHRGEVGLIFLGLGRQVGLHRCGQRKRPHPLSGNHGCPCA